MPSNFARERALAIKNEVPWKKCGAFSLWYLMGKTNHMLKFLAGLVHGPF